MNYVKFNDNDSRDIKGLIICDLPPITKPKMRTNTTTIDGKDGSIIEELGYSSYTKTISIGLTYDYDIDEIMEFFNGSGKMVFSNEPDKYYNVVINDEIDFEKLLRFKTAKIKMVVQPYKYLYKEATQKYGSPSTNIIVLNRGLRYSKPKMKITGSGTIQILVNGTGIFSYTFPSGDSSVVIDSATEDAYLGSILKNRNMTGEFPLLKPGKNIITWTGTITQFEIDANSRWL